MPSAHLTLKEEEVIKLLLEFLSNRELSISQLSVERESGVINGTFSDDILFLRQLILDGQWDDVLEFVKPLEGIETFDSKQFRYIVIKHKYIELLCIRSESGIFQNVDVAVEEVVKSLAELEKYCPSKEDYNNLCLLVTLPRLSDHFEYRNWNPSNARVNCFKAVFPLVEKFLPLDKKGVETYMAKGDRLIQLIIKGVLYESCVEYCQQRATSSSSEMQEMGFSHILNGTGFSDSDLSLLSWLQCIPPETFSYPFEQKTLSVDVEQLDKPSLEASWSEQILVAPIKPKIFPHSAMPFTRLRTSDFMSKSLTPNLDTLGRNSMAYSVGDLSNMSRSYAGFHLTGKKAMNTSVDRLFEGGDVFSTSCADLQSDLEACHISSKNKFTVPPKILEQISPKAEEQSVPKKEKDIASKDSAVEEDSLRPSTTGDNCKSSQNHNSIKTDGESVSDLWKEFQRKQLISKNAQNEISSSAYFAAQDGSNVASAKNVSDVTTCVTHPVTLSTQTKLQNLDKMPTSTPKPTCRALTPIMQGSPILSRNDDSSLDGSSLRSIPSMSRNLSPNMNHCNDPLLPNNVGAAHNFDVSPGNHSQKSSPGGSIGRGSNYSPTQRTASPIEPDGNHCRHSPVPSTQVPAIKQVPSMPPRLGQDGADGKKPHFIMVTRLEDAQAIRAAEFHPSGQLYAIGSNSKTLRICAYPKVVDLKEDHVAHQPTVLYKKVKHHKGSIYCLAWNPTGELLATGSNDKTVKLMKFNMETCNVDSNEAELTMHDGTVRDMCFIEDTTSRSSLLISGGAGDCKIYVTDCETATPFQALSGHSGHILSLYTWGGAMFVSGSQDRTIRFWDLRTKGCVHLVTPPSLTGSGPGSPVTTICVDPSGRLLVSGQEDASCMLYDIRGGKYVQYFRPHTADIRTTRFSPRAYYLLTGSYDHKVVLTDLQGDLTQPLSMIVVAEHSDKVIQGRWHPREFAFLTTSADKTATLWALPLQ
ncbi:WD repeat-containing protein 47-like [Uloborus diversus]|uniref:WD repeat-containing protein 47-like n=1 Tax=Uloborus diversus TaxID=327109 RepID=UPI002409F472|nr:WD repeat-containing protein 47-like [Uloborus diversus]